MIRYAEERLIPYPRVLLQSVVLKVQHYPEFLPWALEARVYNQQDNTFEADLTLGYKMFRESYTSTVWWSESESSTTIVAKSHPGLFNHLETNWLLSSEGEQTLVNFSIVFEVKRSWMTSLIDPFFHEAAKRMVQAFEERVRSQA
jgi:coenzyme Q-binding protein COQ10